MNPGDHRNGTMRNLRRSFVNSDLCYDLIKTFFLARCLILKRSFFSVYPRGVFGDPTNLRDLLSGTRSVTKEILLLVFCFSLRRLIDGIPRYLVIWRGKSNKVFFRSCCLTFITEACNVKFKIYCFIFLTFQVPTSDWNKLFWSDKAAYCLCSSCFFSVYLIKLLRGVQERV